MGMVQAAEHDQMEMTLENTAEQEMKNAIKNMSEDPERKIAVKVRNKWIAVISFIAGIGVLAFSVSRVEMMATFYPCGISLISAALKRDSLNLYLLLPITAGMLFSANGNSYIWGDFAAVVVCAIVFLMLSKSDLPDFYRMVLCVSIMAICNVAYYWMAKILYIFDLRLLLLETVLVAGFYYVFHTFFSLINIGRKTGDKKSVYEYNGSIEGGIVSVAAVWMLAFCGFFVWDASSETLYQIVLCGGFLCTLVLGYKLGISAGVIAGSIVPIVLYMCGVLPLVQMIIFVVSGLTAGFFSGLSKYTSAVCFAAVCLVFGLVCSGGIAAMPLLPPVLAAAVFSAVRGKAEETLDSWLMRFEKREPGESVSDIKARELMQVLSGYKECFTELANLYSMEKDSRSMVSYQFRGMEQVVNQMELDIKAASRGRLSVVPANTESRFDIEVGASGYARSGSVSGDSYICRMLPDGRYIMILSDGMGKGERAALESTLAVKTLANLIEAGFEVELALKTLNSILLLKTEEEIFSTIDIAIFSRDTGRLRLYKVGAASTFIKRKDQVSAVKMAALPMGIVNGLKIDFVNVRLHAGDQIIMVSDGIIDSKRNDKGEVEEPQWLTEAIMSIKSKDPATMADLIINRAVENYGIKEKDDLTVISAVIR